MAAGLILLCLTAAFPDFEQLVSGGDRTHDVTIHHKDVGLHFVLQPGPSYPYSWRVRFDRLAATWGAIAAATAAAALLVR